MDSFIKYLGGKSLLRNKIISLMPPHRTYIEPFCGGSWVLFQKPISLIEVINDVDDEIINMYEVVKNKLKMFIKWLQLIPISESLFNYYCNEDVNGIPLRDPKRNKIIGIPEMGAKTYYKIMNCFNGNLREKPNFAFGSSHKSSFVRFYKTDWNKIRDRLKEVTILNRDFKEILKKYDDPKSFFYLDPPYMVATDKKSYYRNTFSMKDHNDLLVYLIELQGKFILSYDNNDSIKNMYEEFNIIESNEFPNELIITNYKPPDNSYFKAPDGIPKEAMEIKRANWNIPNCPYCGSRDTQKVSKRVTIEGNKRNWIPCGFTCRECKELFKIS